MGVSIRKCNKDGGLVSGNVTRMWGGGGSIRKCCEIIVLG